MLVWNLTQVVEAVHAKGSYIYLQLWAMGRTVRPDILHKEFPDAPFVGPSPIALSTQPEHVPRELTKDGACFIAAARPALYGR